MKKMIIASAFVLSSLLPVSVRGQAVDWETHPELHTVPDSLGKEAAVFILDQRNIRVVSENKDIVTYRTVHRIIKIETEKGVEYFNAMTFNAGNGNEMAGLYARTITASGKVIKVADDKIKTNLGEEGGIDYHVAFEGVEIGAEIEVVSIERKSFAAFGQEAMQFGLPVMKASFSLECPVLMEFETKGYNGFPTASELTLGETRYYTAERKNIMAAEEEEYSDFSAQMMREEYKLSHVGNSSKRLYTWQTLAEKVQQEYYTFSKKDLKDMSRFLEQNGVTASDREQDKIRKIEQAIKTSIVMKEDLTEEKYTTPSSILELKTANEVGVVKLFAAAFQVMNVNAQMGLTTNRFQSPLDEKFENWRLLDVYLFYFPDIKEYMAPSFMTFRCPMIPAAVRENKGVFFNPAASPGYQPDIRNIPALHYVQSANMLDAAISFDENMSPEVKAEHAFTGYSAQSLREAFVFMDKEKEAEMVQSLVNIAEKKEDIVSYSVENVGLEYYIDNKPLIVKSVIKTPQLAESAGNKVLLKIGDVIGPQAQLYAEKERKFPISMPFAHTLDRKLVVDIPEGYRIANPDDINLDVHDKESSMGFKSSYKMEGNKMVISANEFYSRTSYPASEMDAFRKVINAAADFNKITLVLERK